MLSANEPETACIAKGKAHKKYEYGSKASIVRTIRSRAITAVKTFAGNPYDGDTLQSTLAQSEAITGRRPTRCYTDLGYRGKRTIEETAIIHPRSNKTVQSGAHNACKTLPLQCLWSKSCTLGVQTSRSHRGVYRGIIAECA